MVDGRELRRRAERIAAMAAGCMRGRALVRAAIGKADMLVKYARLDALAEQWAREEQTITNRRR